MIPTALCLDLYDTLLYIEQDVYEQGKTVSASRLKVPPKKFMQAWGACAPDAQVGRITGTKERAARTADVLGVHPTPETLEEIANDDEHWQLRCTHPLPGVLNMLETACRKGLKLALVSNASHSSAHVLKKHGLHYYFESIVFSFQTGVRKPEKAIYERALADLSVDAAHTLFAGDGDSHELEGAKTVGMRTCLVDFPQRNTTFLDKVSRSAGADYSINKWDDFWGLDCWTH